MVDWVNVGHYRVGIMNMIKLMSVMVITFMVLIVLTIFLTVLQPEPDIPTNYRCCYGESCIGVDYSAKHKLCYYDKCDEKGFSEECSWKPD